MTVPSCTPYFSVLVLLVWYPVAQTAHRAWGAVGQEQRMYVLALNMKMRKIWDGCHMMHK